MRFETTKKEISSETVFWKFALKMSLEYNDIYFSYSWNNTKKKPQKTTTGKKPQLIIGMYTKIILGYQN